MGKKYKSKSVSAQKKKVDIPPSKEGSEPVNAEASKGEVKSTEPKMKSPMEEAIATMLLRLDQRFQRIKEIQKQRFQLHLQQVKLIDGYINLLQERIAIEPRYVIECKLVLKTIQEIQDAHEHFLPAQLDILKRG